VVDVEQDQLVEQRLPLWLWRVAQEVLDPRPLPARDRGGLPGGLETAADLIDALPAGQREGGVHR
jgi:hypothetical protein